ncbi:MAG: N-acetylneuraminate synthase family protein [Planctomycetota bacterium]|nr:N-acetylneuraminate synthase family protein [Planctomycetota bacterium]
MHIGNGATGQDAAARAIGNDAGVYVIAEIGVNHDGSAARALELTDAAAAAGADAVKLQLFATDMLMSKAAKLAAYQTAAGETNPLAMLRRLELSLADMALVVDRAHCQGIHAIVTVFSTELVAGAETLAWDAYKSASPDIIHRPLLDAMASTAKPMIVSTGASTIDEVLRAARWLEAARDRLALLQCVSSYPAPDAALEGIAAIARATGLPTGYSDHTPGAGSGARAVEHGACLLEKHLTYDVRAAGPDHAASLEPHAFAEYVSRAKAATRGAAMAAGEKCLLECERDVRAVSRQSLTTRRALPAGHVLTANDLTVKRPGTGIEPWRLEEVVGQRLVHDVEADALLRASDIMLAMHASL